MAHLLTTSHLAVLPELLKFKAAANTFTLGSTSNGKITTGSNKIILSSSTSASAISGATSTRYIVGNLQFSGITSGTTGLVYPIGTSAIYAPATLNNVAATGTISV